MPARTATLRCAATGRKPGYPLVLPRPTLPLGRTIAEGLASSSAPRSHTQSPTSSGAASLHTSASACKQSRSSHQYLERQRRDPYVLARNSPAAANAIGIPSLDKWINIGHGPMIPGCVSRAAFKLYELNWQARFLTRPPAELLAARAAKGPTVKFAPSAQQKEEASGVQPKVILDLGAAPGGWTQIAFALLHDQYRLQRDVAKGYAALETVRKAVERARGIEERVMQRLEQVGAPEWARSIPITPSKPGETIRNVRGMKLKYPNPPKEPSLTEKQRKELDKLREDPLFGALWRLRTQAKVQTLKLRYTLSDIQHALTKATNNKRRPGDTIDFEKLKIEPVQDYSKGIETDDASTLALPADAQGEQTEKPLIHAWEGAQLPAPPPTAIFALDLLPLHPAVQNLVTAFGREAPDELERQADTPTESTEEEEEDMAKRHVHLDFLKGDFTSAPVQAELQRRIAAWKAQFEPQDGATTAAQQEEKEEQAPKVHPVTGSRLPPRLDQTGSLKVQVILSDMSPNISGSAVQNEGNYLRLLESLLQFTAQHLQPGEDSWLVVKVFYSPGVEEFRKVFLEGKPGGSDVAFSTEGIPKGGMFRSVKAEKVKGSRVQSREIYWVCRGFRGYNVPAKA